MGLEGLQATFGLWDDAVKRLADALTGPGNCNYSPSLLNYSKLASCYTSLKSCLLSWGSLSNWKRYSAAHVTIHFSM